MGFALGMHAVNVVTPCEYCDVGKHAQGDLHSWVILLQVQGCELVGNMYWVVHNHEPL